MAFTATQYKFAASAFTATTSATVGSASATSGGGYVVPAATNFSIIALTLSNSGVTNQMAYADVGLFDGTNSWTMLRKVPIIPGGAVIVEGVQKQTLPSGGAVYINAYATIVTAIMTGVEIT